MPSRMPDYRVDLVRLLRRQQTDSEQAIWEHLRAGRMEGHKFRRQRPLGRYVADFCCDALHLVIEIDGGAHDTPEQQQYDVVRDATLAAHGYALLRLRTEEVFSFLPYALAKIRRAIQKCAAPNSISLPNPLPSEGGFQRASAWVASLGEPGEESWPGEGTEAGPEVLRH